MALTKNGNYTPDERIVSPGVFTRENDQSFLAQGVAQIGGVVVAPFPKGPGFYPTVITNANDLSSIFGDPDGVLYGPYTAQQYLAQQGQVTICRVGGLAGYTQKGALVISAFPGQYDRFVESGSFSGSTLGTVITTDGLGNFSIQGTLSAKFTTGEYAGDTLVVGQISGSVITPVYSASVLQSGVFNGILYNQTLPIDPNFPTTVVSSSFVIVNVSPCKQEAQFNGNIVGAYGVLNAASWTPGTASSEDDCGGVTGSGTRDEVVLAVLANTALDRGQELYGFSGSILTPTNEALSSVYQLALNETYFDVALGQYISSSYGTYTFSVDPSNPSYITAVFGTNPEAGYVAVATGQKVEAAYTYVHFDNLAQKIVNEMLASGSWKIQVSVRDDALTFADGITPDVGTSAYDLREAVTPFIRSQQISPYSGSGPQTAAEYDLFAVHTLSDGTNMNTTYKIEISNVKSPGSIPNSDFGAFDLTVRNFYDTDQRTNILESYPNLSLDPNSANFVARKIGDTYSYIDFNGKITEYGTYANVSKLIRIEMASSPYPDNSIPFGFGPYSTPVGGDYARLGKLPSIQYTSASIWSESPGRYASGIAFNPAPANSDDELAALYPNGTEVGPERDNFEYFNPIPIGAATKGAGFSLQNIGVTPDYVPTNESVNRDMRRFVLGFQAGFDGQSPSIPILVGNDIIPTNQQGLDCSTNKSFGTYAYKQALAALGNADEWDFNLIVIPGINYQYHPYVATLAVNVCETRGDAFYIMDIAPNQVAGDASINNVIELASDFDTNYAATYYPWIKILDSNTNKIIPVPPSVPMMSVYAANDAVAAEWFAPAGLNRGGLPAAKQVIDRLTHRDRDSLYENKVNPIAAFPGQGIVAWGNKTLQQKPSALDRINVRRLLIALKKFIASSSRYLVFEQSVSTTWLKFTNMANPYLEGVQQRSGLYAFKVVMDSSNNTPDKIDQNIMYGQIWLQPTKTAEFIILDFNITPTGAQFGTGV
jgi:hypothetical protein